MRLYSKITVQGAANIVTDFNPYTFYTQNNNYMKIVLCHDYLSVYSNYKQYLYNVNTNWWSCEQANRGPLGKTSMNMGSTVGVNSFQNTSADTAPVTITINNGSVVTTQGGTSVTTSFSGNLPNNNLIFYEANNSTSYHGTLCCMMIYGENDELKHNFIGFSSSGQMGITDKVTGTKYLPTGSNYTMNVEILSTIAIDPETIISTATGSTENIAIDSETNWTATTTSDWFTLSATGGTSADTAITITTTINDGIERTGNVVFSNAEDSATLTVTQKAGMIMWNKTLKRGANTVAKMYRSGVPTYRKMEKSI